jgi:hypothetical protein
MLIGLFLVLGMAAAVNAAPTWDTVAAQFGCTQKIQEGEQASGAVYMIEYLPKDQKAGKHDRIFTITLMRVSQDAKEADQQAQQAMRSVANSAIKAGAKITEFNGYPTNHGTVAFFDYVLNGEHNLGIMMQTGPGTLATYQLGSLNGKTASAEDRKKLRSIIGLQ